MDVAHYGKYEIDPYPYKWEDQDEFIVRATSYEHAANCGVKRLLGRKSGLHARRVTGESGKSGLFQGYIPCKTGGWNATGGAFHVQSV